MHGGDEDGIVHLSHHTELRARVEQTDGGANVRLVYGGKGSGLIYISYLNIPTPDGFVIPTTLAGRRAREQDDR